MRLELAKVFGGFESLGNNCEFGIVQRAAGANPPGLFRNVGFRSTEQITKAIRGRLDGLFDDGKYEFTEPDDWTDYALDCKRYGFRFHTGINRKRQERFDRQRAIGAFRFLKRQFLEVLDDGETTFVYRHDRADEVGEDRIRQLWAALCAGRRNSLLVVTADGGPDGRFGHVACREPGLFVASLSRLSAENPPKIDYAAWEKICRSVVEMRSEAETNAPHGLPPVPQDAEHPAVTAHHLPSGVGLNDARLMDCALDGLVPAARYTVQADVFIPADVDCLSLGIALLGYPSERFRTADVSRRGVWQRISVTAMLPPTKTRALMILVARYRGERDGCIFTSNWRVAAEAPPITD
jgi:hypothetical protein